MEEALLGGPGPAAGPAPGRRTSSAVAILVGQRLLADTAAAFKRKESEAALTVELGAPPAAAPYSREVQAPAQQSKLSHSQGRVLGWGARISAVGPAQHRPKNLPSAMQRKRWLRWSGEPESAHCGASRARTSRMFCRKA
ncbi:hypothetical protein GCM10027034_14650 [Ramlibacter solisilvae]